MWEWVLCASNLWVSESQLVLSDSCDPKDYIQPMGFSRPGYWSEAFPFSRESSQLRDQTQVSCLAGGFFTSWATKEAQEYCSG